MPGAPRLEEDPQDILNVRAYLANGFNGLISLGGQHVIDEIIGSPALPEVFGISDMIPAESPKGLLLFYSMALTTWMPCSRRVHPSSRPAFYTVCFGKDPEACGQRVYMASPLRHHTKDYPPCFVSCSGTDPLLPKSRTLSEALAELGVHRRDLCLNKPEYPHVRQGCLIFHLLKLSREGIWEAIASLQEHAAA